ncbi:MAG: hypothetical protein NZ699_07790 [Roseiflexus sp.]|nr:hypothetical protein [Roseiflexus sp.]
MSTRQSVKTALLILTIATLLLMTGVVSCQRQEMGAHIPPDRSTLPYSAHASDNTLAVTAPASMSAMPSSVLNQDSAQTPASSSVLRTSIPITTTMLPPIDESIQGKGDEDMATPVLHAAFLRSQGVLYVRVEYHQAQLGLSVIKGGGQFRPLTTVYEWWIDARNDRYRRATSELLEDGPHLVGADGADGATSWWIVDWTRGITAPERHQGKPPFGLSSLDDFAAIFAREGRPLIEAVRSNQEEVQIVEQTEHPLWGAVLTIRRTNAKTGHVLTASVRAEAPNIVLESITTDQQGQLFEHMRITHWEWFDLAQFDADFWLYPPQGIPVGFGHPGAPPAS